MSSENELPGEIRSWLESLGKGRLVNADRRPGGPGNALFYWKWNGAEGWGENQGGSTDWYPRRRPTP